MKKFTVLLFINLMLGTGTLFSQEALPIDIYDYQPDDQFHFFYYYDLGEIYVYNYTVLERIMSQQEDVLTYKMLVQGYHIYNFWDTAYFSNIEFQTYTNLYEPLGDIDTIVSNPDMYNGRTQFIDLDEGPWYVSAEKWAIGCGYVYDYYWSYSRDYITKYELKYFKKGDETWGAPLIVGTNEISSKEPLLKLHPNPAHDKCHLFFPHEMIGNSFKIFDVTGKLLLEQKISAMKHEVDVSGFPRGMVIISITGNTLPLVKKLLLN